MTTVGNILRAKGIIMLHLSEANSPMGRHRAFHVDVMSFADFFKVEVWTMHGFVRNHVFL